MATFALIHGKWHCGACWEPLVEELRERGHAVVAPDLPLSDSGASFAERAQAVVDALADAAEPVVVVAHSLGAAYGPLVAAARPVDLLVYLCPAPTGLLNRDDAPLPGTRPEFPFPPLDDDRISRWGSHEAAIAAMYERLPADVARDAAAALKPDAPARGDYPLAHHPRLPTAVVLATEDEFFFPEWTRWAAGALFGTEAIELAGGHFPMLEAPARLAELLDDLAVANRTLA